MDALQESDSNNAAGGHLGPAVPNQSLRDAARAFITALATADSQTLKVMNRGINMGFPTGYLLSRFSEQYTRRSLGELVFDVNEEQNRVAVSSLEGEILDAIRFKKQGDQYFFSHFERY